MATALSRAQSARKPETSGKDYAAEGLRGIAALSVWLAHFCLTFFPAGFSLLYPALQTTPAAEGPMERFLRMPVLSAFWDGNFAVAIFFVLSGYVLSKPYYFGRNIESLRDRYLRRYFRLAIPIAASVFVGYGLMKLGTFQNIAAANVSHSDWLRSFFVVPATVTGAIQDSLYRVMFLGEARFNPPLWTMRVEFVGSLITFAFYALMPEGPVRKCLHYSMALASIILFTGADAIYYCAFLAGALLWVIPPPRALWNWALLALGIALGGYQFDGFYGWLHAPAGYDAKAFYNAFGAFAILWALRSGMLDFALASRLGRTLGRLSFSLYLTHFFVLSTFSCWFFVRFAPIWPRWEVALVDFVLSTPLLFIAAYIFERFVDRPGVALSKRIVAAR